MNIVLTYIGSFIVFMGIDLLWLGFVAKDLYQKQLGSFLSPEVNWTAASIFYLLFVAGILFFATWPNLDKTSVQPVLLYGAAFGFITYATYDLTNLATLKGWPLQIVIIDMIWGSILSMLVATAGWYIARWLMNV